MTTCSGAIVFIIFFIQKLNIMRRRGVKTSLSPGSLYLFHYFQPGSKKGSGSTAPVVRPLSKSASEGSSQRNGQNQCLNKIPVNKHIQSLKGILKVIAISTSIIWNDFVKGKGEKKKRNHLPGLALAQ